MSSTVPSTTGSTVVEPVSGDVRVALEPSGVAPSTINRLRAITSGGFRSTFTRRLKTGFRLSGILAVLVAAGCSNSPTNPAESGDPAASPEGETASVEITPGELHTTSGQGARLTAVARDADGQTLLEDAEWTSSEATVAIVDSDGTVWSFKSGTSTATATFPGKSGSAPGQLKKTATVEVTRRSRGTSGPAV